MVKRLQTFSYAMLKTTSLILIIFVLASEVSSFAQGSVDTTSQVSTGIATGTNQSRSNVPSGQARNEASLTKHPFGLSSMLFIIALCGLVGGYANYRRTVNQLTSNAPATNETLEDGQAEKPVVVKANKEEQKYYLQTCLILGVVAAALVPLFLNSVSSTLLDNQNDITTLIFTGFCLLAAVSSATFIDALSQRILSQTKQLRDETVKQVNKSAALLQSAQEVNEQINAQASIVREGFVQQEMVLAAPAEIQPNFKFEIRVPSKAKLVRLDIDGTRIEGDELVNMAGTAVDGVVKGSKFVPLVDENVFLIIDAVGEPNHQLTLSSFKFLNQDLLSSPQSFTIGDNRRGQLAIDSIKLS